MGRTSESFAADIEAAADGQPIEAVLIHREEELTWRWYGPDDHDDPRHVDAEWLGRTLTWEQARPLLDYAYDRSHGGQDCHDITAWTADRVLFVWEYDGATWVEWRHRNPPAAA